MGTQAANKSFILEGWLSGLVRDAIASGQVVLVAQIITAQETSIVKEVIEALVVESKDIASKI